MICARCKTANDDSLKACTACGADLSPQAAEGDPPPSLDGMPTVPAAAQSVADAPKPALSLGDEQTIQRAAHAPANEPAGQVVGNRYEIVRRLGQGGMGVLYLARDLTLRRQVALKRLRAPEEGALKGIERFLQEARAIAALNHRNIVTVHELGEDDRGPYIVMEYLGGGDLAKVLAEKGKLDLPAAMAIIKPIAQALSYAHRRGIIHRDIKPSNIILADDGSPKLGDFGLAQMARDSELSLTGFGMGTAAYMAPEQRRDAKHADHRSDIFALGKTLYHMLSGEVEAVDLELVPLQVRPALRKAMKLRPEDRPFSVEEFITDLERSAEDPAQAVAVPGKVGVCRSCRYANALEAKFCKSCGAGMFEKCPKCGAEDRVGTIHCGACGTHIGRYKEASEALTRAREHMRRRELSRAAKEAKRGSQHNCLLPELAAVAAEAQGALDRVESLKAEATSLIEQEKFEAAQEKLAEALQIDPGQAELDVLLKELPARIRARDVAVALQAATAAQAAGNFVELDRQCERIASLEPETAELASLRSISLAARSDHDSRLARAASLVQTFDLQSAFCELQAAKQRYPWDPAIDALANRASEINGQLDGLRKRVKAAMDKRDLKGARQAWQALAAIHPANAEAQAQIGQLNAVLRRKRLRRIKQAVILAVLAVGACIAVLEARQNQQHLAMANQHIGGGRLDHARDELGRCGWFWSWGKAQTAASLWTAERNHFVERAENCLAEGRHLAAVQELRRSIGTPPTAALQQDAATDVGRRLAAVKASWAQKIRELCARSLWKEAEDQCVTAIEAFPADQTLVELIAQERYRSLIALAAEAMKAGDLAAATARYREAAKFASSPEQRQEVASGLRDVGAGYVKQANGLVTDSEDHAGAVQQLRLADEAIGQPGRHATEITRLLASEEAMKGADGARRDADAAASAAGSEAPTLAKAEWDSATRSAGQAQAERKVRQYAKAQALWEEAQKAYGQAKSATTQAVARRAEAKDAQTQCAARKKEAEDAKASTYATTQWTTAQKSDAAASDLFTKLDFTRATIQWTAAGQEYDRARQAATQAAADETSALAAKKVAGDAQTAARDKKAQEHAPTQWAAAARRMGDAQTLYDNRQYLIARDRWNEAAAAFEAAGVASERNHAAKLIADARASFDRQLYRTAMATVADALRLLPGDPDARKEQARLDAVLSLKRDLGGGIALPLVFVEAGNFSMGSPKDEDRRGADETRRLVKLSRSFYIGAAEVTQAQWRAVMSSSPSVAKGDDRPVENVSWDDASEFCRRLGEKLAEPQGRFRLPTEAQWEYACRTGEDTPFSFGGSIHADQANFNSRHAYGDSQPGVARDQTVAAAALKANAWGLYDMHGNVWEWCADWYGDLEGTDATDPSGAAGGDYRVLRGGSWRDPPWMCRSALRHRLPPQTANGTIGFRVVMVLEAAR